MIAVATPELSTTGGIERYTTEVALALSRRDHRVTVVTSASDLDDTSLETALWHYARGNDPVLATLAISLRERKLLKSIKLRDEVEAAEVRARVEPLLERAGFDPRYFIAIDRVSVQAYVEDEALVVLSGARVQSLLEASQVMRGLSSEVFVSNRVMFPAALREVVAAAIEDLR